MGSPRPVRGICALIISSLLAITPLLAQETPRGANSVEDLYSPEFMGGGAFVTATGNAQADAVNPAANGAEQRIVLDGGYAILPGLGTESGFGHAVNLGGILPTKYGVFSGSLRMLSSPFDSYPIGTGVGLKLSAAKEVYPRLTLGVGLGAAVGTDWSVGLDLGVRQGLGDISFMKDFYWAATLGGLGKGWAPSAFTPKLGAAFDLVRVAGKEGKSDAFKLGLASELGFPGFTNLSGKLGLQANILGLASIGSSVGFNLVEALDGKAASPIPSFGLSLNFTLAGETEGTEGEVRTNLSARPLYDDIWAFGTGATVVLGVVDRVPPKISVGYPKPIWISPNNDGKADALEFDLSITDKRYVASWVFIVENEKGEMVRLLSNKERRPENEGFRDIMARILDVKSGVEVPPSLRWDGVDEGGAVVADGRYLFHVEARDDNGNQAVTDKFEVFVDNTPPKIEVSGPEIDGLRVFSPDGDGSKDSYPIAQSGSEEDLWQAVVQDSAGTTVRNFKFENAAPSNLEWNGKDNAELVVPDGVYKYRMEATDRAFNQSSALIENIILNTERPPVGLLIDGSDFSPNGDSIQDELAFSPGVPITEGLVSWTIEVRNSTDTVRRTFTGGADIPVRVVFDGKADNGSPVEEGSYQGNLTARYRNGYEAKAKSPLFNIDVSTPVVSVLRPGSENLRTFSPDGDKRKDSFTISQTGSREDRWAAVIQDSAGKTVRTLSWEGMAPPEFVWDGSDDSGRTVPDGVYRYNIAAKDRAGNSASASMEGIIADTSKPVVALSIAYGHYSPNGDGVLDELPVITSVAHATAAEAWSVELVDTRGTSLRSFKGTGTAPDRLTFGGTDDKNQRLGEGEYRGRITVEYRNGYISSALSPQFIIDLTAPIASAKAENPVFSPNGDGNLDLLALVQNGSEEVTWVGEILSNGRPVRLWTFTGTPSPRLEWDGLDDAGRLSPDGTYGYRLSATDRAGNRGSVNAPDFTLTTENTPLLVVVDQRAFSPNGDKQKDEMTITAQVKLIEGINSWRVDILDSTGQAIRTFEGANGAPSPLIWNGKDSRGATVKDGSYTAKAELRYAMGNRPQATSTPFIVDTIPPAIELSVADQYFSPNGDKRKDSLEVKRLSQGSDDEWTLLAQNSEDITVRTWTWKGVSGNFTWDGKDSAGNIVADGAYSFVAEGKDNAGNTKKAVVSGLVVDTQAPIMDLAVADPAFSPNADGRKDMLSISQQAVGNDAWEGRMQAANGTTVRTWIWKGSADDLEWDGKNDTGVISADGIYKYLVKSSDEAGNSSEYSLGNLLLDTKAPELDLAFPFMLFSPNGDKRKDELPVNIKTVGDDDWEANMLNKNGAVLASWKWKAVAPTIAWNGKDSAGNTVPDGSYRFSVRSTDTAGNHTERSAEGLTVDNRTTRAFLTAASQGLSPNSDGLFDSQRFGLVVTLKEGIEAWKLDILDENGMLRRTLGTQDASGSRSDLPPDAITWNGLDSLGSLREGKYTARLSVAYLKGDLTTANAGPFMVDATAPVLSVETNPRYFSPDNDGVEDELIFSPAAKDASAIDTWSLEIREPQAPFNTFYRIEGKGAPAERVVWDGRSNKGELVQAATDYPLLFTATDAWGNTRKLEGIVGVDVLVIREGDILKIKVPSIIFRENEADFLGLAQDTVDNNIRVLKRIAQILNKFRDYKVKVEGHANPVSRTAKEEKEELQPLSERRAKAVLAKLVEFGVDAPRLSAVGRGGTQPVVKWEERADWWKNRRVEFILVK